MSSSVYKARQDYCREHPNQWIYWSDLKFEYRLMWCPRRKRHVSQTRSLAHDAEAGVSVWF